MDAKTKAEPQKPKPQQTIHNHFFKLCEQFVEFKLLFLSSHPESQTMFLREFERYKSGEKDCFVVRRVQKT